MCEQGLGLCDVGDNFCKSIYMCLYTRLLLPTDACTAVLLREKLDQSDSPSPVNMLGLQFNQWSRTAGATPSSTQKPQLARQQVTQLDAEATALSQLCQLYRPHSNMHFHVLQPVGGMVSISGRYIKAYSTTPQWYRHILPVFQHSIPTTCSARQATVSVPGWRSVAAAGPMTAVATHDVT